MLALLVAAAALPLVLQPRGYAIRVATLTLLFAALGQAWNVVGGVAVGVVQSLSSLAFPMQLQNLVLFVVFLAVLAFRPQGLLKGAA